MDVRSSTAPGVAATCNVLVLRNGLAIGNDKTVEVTVVGLVAARVVQNDQPAIATSQPAADSNERGSAAVARTDESPGGTGDVQPGVGPAAPIAAIAELSSTGNSAADRVDELREQSGGCDTRAAYQNCQCLEVF